MILNHTMRFGADIFGLDDGEATSTEEGDSDSGVSSSFLKKALLVSKQPWDCTSKSEVTKIVASGAKPSGTNIRYMFKIDNKYWYFNGSALTEFTDTLNVDNVLKSGNIGSQLGAISPVPDFLGKKIYPIIAMSAPSDAEDLPRVKLSLKVKVPFDTLSDVVESPVYELVEEDESTPRISEITFDTTCTGDASVNVLVRLRTGTAWTNYLTLDNASDKEAQAVQFKITYKVTKTDGSESAKLNSITVDHTMGKTVVSGGNADLFTQLVNHENELQTCYVTVRHAPLSDSRIEAYINFMKPPSHRNLIQIGTATGSRQELALGLNGLADENIVASTIELYVDAAPFANFSYNSQVGTVTFTAKRNSVITATYDYDHGQEIWTQMPLEYTEPYNDVRATYLSRYCFTLADDATKGKTVSNVRLKMVRPSGKVTNGSLGYATGKTQLFVLRHVPKASSIKFSDATVDFDYNEDNNILSLIAPKNTPLLCSYSWTGESVTVYSFAAGWACA